MNHWFPNLLLVGGEGHRGLQTSIFQISVLGSVHVKKRLRRVEIVVGGGHAHRAGSLRGSFLFIQAVVGPIWWGTMPAQTPW